MIHQILESKSNKLFIILAGIFITNALIAEYLGCKIFSLEDTLGLPLFSFSFFGEQNLSMNLTAGVLIWPIVFILTDIINEYYGLKGVRFISYLTVVLIIFSFVCAYFAIHLSPASWWLTSNEHKGVPDNQKAYSAIFGQGMWIVFASVIAFLIGQILDVIVFHKIKKITGENKIWLRATGSTLFSQLIDSMVVIVIAFKIGADWSWGKVMAIALVGYIYKFVIAIFVTPFIYFVHYLIERYLGKNLATEMKNNAMR